MITQSISMLTFILVSKFRMVDISVLLCLSDWIMADIMTKALPRAVFEYM